MLGIPSTGSFIETRSNYDARVNSHGAFVHDDWRVSDRLTLNLGVRYDLELGLTRGGEPQHRRLRSRRRRIPIEAQARANFGSEPAGGRADRARRTFNVRGGYTYLSGDQKSAWNADTNNFQPRAGFTYKLSGSVGAARRRRAVHRAVSDSGRARHHDRTQSDRVFAQHAGSGDERQRPDVPGESDQSDSERSAARRRSARARG